MSRCICKQGFNTWGETYANTPSSASYLRQADRLNSILSLGGLGQRMWHIDNYTFDTNTYACYNYLPDIINIFLLFLYIVGK